MPSQPANLKHHILLNEEFVYCNRLDPTFIVPDDTQEIIDMGNKICFMCLREKIYQEHRAEYLNISDIRDYRGSSSVG